MLGLSSHTHSSILQLMSNKEVLAVDLGQSGTRFKQGDLLVTCDRGKVAG